MEQLLFFTSREQYSGFIWNENKIENNIINVREYRKDNQKLTNKFPTQDTQDEEDKTKHNTTIRKQTQRTYM